MSLNVFLTPEWIAREALTLLQSNMVAGALFHRDVQSEFTSGFKKGDTINIRRPTNAVIEEFVYGVDPTRQPVKQTQVPIVLEKHFDANIEITARDQTLELEDFSNQVLAPYMLEMAEQIDTYALTKMNLLPNSSPYVVGAANSIGDVAQLRKTANNLKIPMRDRRSIVDTEMEADLLSIDSFVTADKVGDDGTTLREASLGRVMGINWFMDQNVDSTLHTNGTNSADITLGANVTEGDTALTLAATSGAVNAGDIITVNGTNFTENFTVKTTTTITGSASVPVNEPARFAHVSADTVDQYNGSADTFFNRGAIFNEGAIALAAVPLDLPASAERAFYVNSEGYALRIVWSYDQQKKADVMAIDILVGAAVIDGRLGYRIDSTA